MKKRRPSKRTITFNLKNITDKSAEAFQSWLNGKTLKTEDWAALKEANVIKQIPKNL